MFPSSNHTILLCTYEYSSLDLNVIKSNEWIKKKKTTLSEKGKKFTEIGRKVNQQILYERNKQKQGRTFVRWVSAVEWNSNRCAKLAVAWNRKRKWRELKKKSQSGFGDEINLGLTSSGWLPQEIGTGNGTKGNLDKINEKSESVLFGCWKWPKKWANRIEDVAEMLKK